MSAVTDLKAAAAFLPALLCAAPGAAKAPPLPPYPHALRCAALTEAAAKLYGMDGPEGRVRFDHALFWGLAAADSAKAAKLTAARFKQDQLDAGALALAHLKGRNDVAAVELFACDGEVPPLKK